MTPFFAIVKLTCRSAMRSNVFRLLLFLLVLSVILVPNTIKSDGSPEGFIQLILQYSRQNFTEDQKAQLNTEVFAGRRVYRPVQPDITEEVEKELQRRIENARINGQAIDT